MGFRVHPEDFARARLELRPPEDGLGAVGMLVWVLGLRVEG